MKTAIQELIENIQKRIASINEQSEKYYGGKMAAPMYSEKKAYETVIKSLHSLLPQDRQQIEDAFDAGWTAGTLGEDYEHNTASDYYEQTFNTTKQV